MFKLPTAFHSSMVADVPDFHYGDVQHASPFPYPHKGLISQNGFDHLIASVRAVKETLGLAYGLAIHAGPGFLPLTRSASPRRSRTCTCSGSKT